MRQPEWKAKLCGLNQRVSILLGWKTWAVIESQVLCRDLAWCEMKRCCEHVAMTSVAVRRAWFYVMQTVKTLSGTMRRDGCCCRWRRRDVAACGMGQRWNCITTGSGHCIRTKVKQPTNEWKTECVFDERNQGSMSFQFKVPQSLFEQQHSLDLLEHTKQPQPKLDYIFL